MAILEVNSISSGYNENPLFQNLSFKLEKPSFVAVLGLNGSGKSTLLKTFAKQNPFQGKILLEGVNFFNIPSKLLSQQLSFLEQKNEVAFSIPVRELAVMGKFRSKSFFQNYSIEDYQEVEQCLGKLKIGHLADRNFPELSGGEQQLVWIAQLMLQQTNIWLLDEPTQHLDIYRKHQVFSLMQDMVQSGKTIICVTHDIANLYKMEGYLLNLSSPNPELEKISKEKLDRNIELLERGF